MAKTNGLKREVAAVIDGFLDGWFMLDESNAFNNFDRHFPGFLYQPMELERPVQHPMVYLNSVREKVIREFKELRWTNIECDVIGDFLWAYVDLLRHTVGHDGTEIRGAYRASFFMTRTGTHWKVIHYHESAQPDMLPPRVPAGDEPPARKKDEVPSDDTRAAEARAAKIRNQPHTGEAQTLVPKMLETFIFGWEARDIEMAYSWWDRDYDNQIYLPLEVASPARAWRDIERYRLWQAEDRSVTGTRWDWKVPLVPEDSQVQVLSDDLVLVYSNLHARGLRLQESEPDESDMPYFTYRVSWLLRRRGSNWKIIHYHESRPTRGPAEVLALGLHPSGAPGNP
mgnify:CR=1 FL=1